jgi:hypothetical protein
MRFIVLAVALSCCFAAPASATPLKPDEIPPALRDWQKWVLHDDDTVVCPAPPGAEDAKQHICVWPGRLELKLDEKGGTFAEALRAYRSEWMPLPGDAKHWPQEVKLDGKLAIVTTKGGAPAVRVAAGDHTLSGRFVWDSLPEALDLPADTALLVLTVRGKPVPIPERDTDGSVFLQKEATAAEAENLEVTVSRKLTDEIPFLLTTHLELNVSGKSREVLLGRALPAGFVPMSVSSALPVRVEADGRIRLQVRPGTFTVDLIARQDAPVTDLTRPVPDGPWAADEVWVFEARPSLRQVLVEGVSGIDPTQTRLPGDWKRFPAYGVGATDHLKLTERTRGDADPPPDALSLTRVYWLDFDGQGMTVSDRLSGQLHRSWRLDMQARTELGRVVASGADQSITRLGAGQPAGVELRQGSLSIEAESRITGSMSEIPAVSWNADFRSVASTLQLPPGWRLIFASGADDIGETWVHSWTLLQIFLVLIIALGIGRLFGRAWGAIALVTLTLTFNETDAPRYVWLAVLVGETLVRVLPAQRIRSVAKLYRLAVWAALVVFSVSFMVGQVRHGMYPALEQERELGAVLSYSAYASDNAAQYARSTVMLKGGETDNDSLQQNDKSDVAGKLGVFGNKDQQEVTNTRTSPHASDAPSALPGWAGGPSPQQSAQRHRPLKKQDYDKNATVQTGPGVPRWEWTRVPFGFSGPVQRAQTLRLWLLPPVANFILALLRSLLLGLLVICLLGFPGSFWPAGFRSRVGGALGAAAAMLVLFAGMGAAHADTTPDSDLLDQLKARLLEAPDCAPDCASSPRMLLDASPNSLRVRVEVLAGAQTAIALPGGADRWLPDHVLLDGKPASAMRRADGKLYLVVPEGAHQIIAEGPLPSAETVQIALPLKPHRVEATLKGWTLDGLHEDGLADDNLQLTRVARDREGGKGPVSALHAGTLPPFVRVERTLVLGLQWTVETRVVRLTPSGSAIVLEVPLLAGEAVTTADVRVQNGKALVNMAPSATEVSWTSLLSASSSLALKAPSALPWVEVWRLDVSPVWHVQPTGIPVVHQEDAEEARVPEWRPWPGESVTISVLKPDSVAGQTFTIDQSQLQVSPGVRYSDVTLTFNLRSSRGGLHAIGLPADAQLQNVVINGTQQPIRQEGQHVSIPLLPGSQSVALSFRQTSGLGAFYETPAIELGTPSVNAEVELQVPLDRWVLLVHGPRMGPAVLFWSFFLVLLFVSFGLSKIPWTPLKVHHWLLLALGVSQVPVPAAAVVFGWLLLLGWRQRQIDFGASRLFNLRQLFIVGVTGVALLILLMSLYAGLLGRPEMQISGNGSSGSLLRWFQDRSTGAVPRGWVLSVPMLVYRGAMLAWSLWLALALLRWLRWAWTAFTAGGGWKKSPPKAAAPPPPIDVATPV